MVIATFRQGSSGAPVEHAGSATSARRLERWLCDPELPVPSLGEIGEAFGVEFAVRDLREAARLASRLRLSLAVLRDVFATDAALRRWLRAPSLEQGGERPLDLLLAGRAEHLEQCAVREWNRAWMSCTPTGDVSCP